MPLQKLAQKQTKILESYLIGFENFYGAGDRDYQDMFLSLQFQTPQNVIPEVPLDTILSMSSMIMAMFGFVAFKRFR